MGAAQDSSACASAIFDQVTSVGNIALNIATFGAGKIAKITQNAAKAAKLQKQFETLQKAVQASEMMQQAIAGAQGQYAPIEAGKSLVETITADPTTVSVEDMIRVSAQIAALADPTGISDIVSAYTYPKCSQIDS